MALGILRGIDGRGSRLEVKFHIIPYKETSNLKNYFGLSCFSRPLVYLPGFGLFTLVAVVALSAGVLLEEVWSRSSWQAGPQQPWSRSLQAGH